MTNYVSVNIVLIYMEISSTYLMLYWLTINRTYN